MATEFIPRTPPTPRTPGGTLSTPLPPKYLTENPSNMVFDVKKQVKKDAKEETIEEQMEGNSDEAKKTGENHQEDFKQVIWDIANGVDIIQLIVKKCF
jgi:negative regulator of genetic competence, sporulation and motility